MRPLSPDYVKALVQTMRGLIQAIHTLAPVHIARDYVPAFDERTPWQRLAQCETGDGFLVWDGASDHTIWGDARTNHAFRAWHDVAHLRIGAGFTLADEIRTCEEQCAELRRLVPCCPASWLAIVRADVIGQAQHFADCGAFPVDQRTFILETIGRN